MGFAAVHKNTGQALVQSGGLVILYKPLGLSVGFSHAARGGKLRYCALLALRQEKERDMTQENQERKSVSVLISSTIAFTVCFMVWMVFGVLAPELKEQLQLNETRKFLLASTPVLTGSLVRVPLGIWTDRYGGRIVLFVLMLIVCGHTICGALVPAAPAGYGNGRVWRGQFRLGAERHHRSLAHWPGWRCGWTPPRIRRCLPSVL